MQGWGLTVSPGTLARASQRLAAKAELTYHHLLLVIRQSRVVHGDETGWKVGGEHAWLWVFTADGVTVPLRALDQWAPAGEPRAAPQAALAPFAHAAICASRQIATHLGSCMRSQADPAGMANSCEKTRPERL